ncbi:MAG: TerD family protein [Vicinamibacteria bacterium]
MAVSLKKGQGVSLSKNDFDLSNVTMGLGWDVAEEKPGFFGTLLGKKPADYDLDAVAFLLGANGKVNDLGTKLVNGDVVFFNSMKHQSGNVWLTGDNRSGAGDGDDEQIIVQLSKLDPRYQRVVFVVQIYNGRENGQSFGNVKNAFIRAVDGRGKEMARFDLSGGASFSNYRSLLFAELTREGDGWKFNAIGQPYETDSFVEILKTFI